MVELTFSVPIDGERRAISGEIVSRAPLVVAEPAMSRPDWRVTDDGRVDMISKKAGLMVTGFGERAVFGPGYCLEHGVLAPGQYRRCPMCADRGRIEAEAMERLQRTPPRSVDDPAPPESYRW